MRRKIVEKALKALQTKIEDQRYFKLSKTAGNPGCF